MTADDTQEAVENAFHWIHGVYQESTALLNEANELFARIGFRCWEPKQEVGRGAYSAYLLARLFSTHAEYDAKVGTDVFVGVSLYADRRHPRGRGPMLLAGTLKRTSNVMNYGLAVVNVAARAPEEGDLFRVVSSPDDGLVVCEPTAAGKSQYPICGVVRSVALPLTKFCASEDVNEVVTALVEMRTGNDGLVRQILADQSRSGSGQ